MSRLDFEITLLTVRVVIHEQCSALPTSWLYLPGPITKVLRFMSAADREGALLHGLTSSGRLHAY
jgi:hypothetical protein